MSLWRRLLVVVAFGLWGVGMYVLVMGSHLVGGVLLLAGGMCLVLAATHGWSDPVGGASDWLYFWR